MLRATATAKTADRTTKVVGDRRIESLNEHITSVYEIRAGKFFIGQGKNTKSDRLSRRKKRQAAEDELTRNIPPGETQERCQKVGVLRGGGEILRGTFKSVSVL